MRIKVKPVDDSKGKEFSKAFDSFQSKYGHVIPAAERAEMLLEKALQSVASTRFSRYTQTQDDYDMAVEKGMAYLIQAERVMKTIIGEPEE